MSISPDVQALHVEYDQESDNLARQWDQLVGQPAREAKLAVPRLVVIALPVRDPTDLGLRT